MRRKIMAPVKYGMVALILELKEAQIKAEAIPLHMQRGNTETQHLKDNDKTTIVMVKVGHINETTALCLPILV